MNTGILNVIIAALEGIANVANAVKEYESDKETTWKQAPARNEDDLSITYTSGWKEKRDNLF